MVIMSANYFTTDTARGELRVKINTADTDGMRGVSVRTETGEWFHVGALRAYPYRGAVDMMPVRGTGSVVASYRAGAAGLADMYVAGWFGSPAPVSVELNSFAAALESGNFSVEKVCTDCTMVLVNGDASGNGEKWDRAEFERVTSAYEITPGHPHGGEYGHDCHAEEGDRCPDDADCDCARDEFSTSACGACGSGLHGTRHDFIFIRRGA